MKTFIVCGNYGAGNIGDEAILRGILYEIAAKEPGSKIYVMAADREGTLSAHSKVKGINIHCIPFAPSGLKSMFKWLLVRNKQLKNAYKESGVFLLGGGGLFTDALNVRAPFIWFIQALFARLNNVEIQMVGQSVGPLRTTLGKKLTKLAFSWAKSISVRDEESRVELTNIGVTGKVEIGIEVKPDYALQLKVHLDEILSGAENEILPHQKSDHKKYAVVSIRFLDRTNKLYEKELVKFIEHLISQDQYFIYLKPFGSANISDEEYMNKLIEQYGLDKNYVHVHTDYSLESTLELIKNAEFLCGMRLHSLILSEVVETPFIGISYHEKVMNFAKSVKKEKHVLRLDEVTVTSLQSLIASQSSS